MRQKLRIGIIGFGNMGTALAQQLNAHYSVNVFDKEKSKLKKAKGATAVKRLPEIFASSDAVIIAVKPQDLKNLLTEAKPFIKNKLILSITAGITTTYIERILGRARVIRIMPNMPAQIGKGMSCLCTGRFACKNDLKIAQKIFSRVGKTLVTTEAMMDTATAVSGSGPAYLCYYSKKTKKQPAALKQEFIAALANSAAAAGFSKSESRLLAETTTNGTVEMLKVTKLTPYKLQKAVTSPGGTTEAALKVLHTGGTLVQAVKAARKRARQLGRMS